MGRPTALSLAMRRAGRCIEGLNAEIEGIDQVNELSRFLYSKIGHLLVFSGTTAFIVLKLHLIYPCNAFPLGDCNETDSGYIRRAGIALGGQIGRASCRERVCQYV